MRRTAVMVMLAIAPIVAAQTTAQRPQFEVASIKFSPTSRFVPAVVDPQQFRITASLSVAILWAYDIHNYQLSDGPPWIGRDYYQIEGRAPATATRQEMRYMLQSLLAERFNLKLHSETKEMAIFALALDKSGVKFQSSTKPCGESGCIDVAPGEFIAKYATMDSISATLSNMVDRPVLDRTGLAGRYDFRLTFDPSSQKRFDGQVSPNTATDEPSIFVALQDIGLKLESAKGPVEVLVIDSVSKPSEN